MDPASIAAALIGAQTGQMQLAVAAKMMKMNADQGAAIAQLVEAAAQSTSQLANLPAGIGRNLDISA
jgi:uncharacterized membrane protein (UPF0136 family)